MSYIPLDANLRLTFRTVQIETGEFIHVAAVCYDGQPAIAIMSINVSFFADEKGEVSSEISQLFKACATECFRRHLEIMTGVANIAMLEQPPDYKRDPHG